MPAGFACVVASVPLVLLVSFDPFSPPKRLKQSTHGPCTAAACAVAIPVWHEAALCPPRPSVPPKQRDFLVRCPLRNFAKLNIFNYYLRSKFIQIVLLFFEICSCIFASASKGRSCSLTTAECSATPPPPKRGKIENERECQPTVPLIESPPLGPGWPRPGRRVDPTDGRGPSTTPLSVSGHSSTAGIPTIPLPHCVVFPTRPCASSFDRFASSQQPGDRAAANPEGV